jgi:vacuolar iron transporter family protein
MNAMNPPVCAEIECVIIGAAQRAHISAIGGALAARAGGASGTPSVIRVTFWGALAMGITAAVGVLFGTVA